MIYLTGDTHGRFERIGVFCDKMQTSRDDILIILGDAGINFHAGALDILRKECTDGRGLQDLWQGHDESQRMHNPKAPCEWQGLRPHQGWCSRGLRRRNA